MNLRKAIQKTIDYGKKYGCNLSMNEIRERLISNRVYSVESLSSCKFNKTVKQKNRKTEKFVKLIKNKFKDILMVGITGSVAAGYPKRNDDIDLMIVTRRNRLWWTRLKLRYFVYKNKIPHRKYGQKENKDEFCFNFWLDEDNLLIPKNRRKLRTAMDLILMKPILNRENVYERFIKINGWAKKWVATGYEKKFLISNVKCQKQNLFKRRAILSYIFNLILFIPQYLFMKRKMKNGEEVGLKRAIFCGK